MPAVPQFSMLLTLPERAFEGILFSAVCSALRFYTAKTPTRHRSWRAENDSFPPVRPRSPGALLPVRQPIPAPLR